ncbi:MAG: tetratricopeptide repeat protein [Planctomycetota bacterium]
MRRSLWITALLCTAALAAPTLAQGRRPPGTPPPQGQPAEQGEEEELDKSPTKFVMNEPAPEPEAEHWLNLSEGASNAAPRLSRYRGRLVVYYFFRTDGTAAETIPDVVAAAKKYGKFVQFLGFTPQAREQAESAVNGKQIKFPVGVGSQMEEKFEIAPPYIYLMDTTGRYVGRFHPGEGLEERIKAQLEKTPPPAADSQAINNRRRQAEKLLSEKQVGRAYTIAKDAGKLLDAQSPDGKRIADLVKRIEEAARKVLDEAREGAKGEKKELALKQLAELSVHFAGESIGGDADTELGRLMGDIKLKTQVRKAVNNAKGAAVNDQAADLEASRRYLEAVKLYRQVTEEFPDTEAAQAAEKSIDRINADPAAQKHIASLRADEEAERWLGLADSYAKIELYNKAREYYERIVETHPTARATAKAKERLAKLPAEEPEPETPPEEPKAKAEDQPRADAGKQPAGK